MSSGGSRTETTTVDMDPWDQAQPYLLDVMSQAKALNNSANGNTFAPFSTVVPFSNQTNSALQMVEDRARNGSPLLNQANTQVSNVLNGSFAASPAQQYLGGTASGAYLNNNPYLDAMFNRGADAITNRINATAGLRGRAGSGAHQQVLQRGLGGLATEVYGQNYQQERTRQLNAATSLQQAYESDLARRMNAVGVAGQMANLPYADAKMLGAVGTQREALAQKELQDYISRHEYIQQQPWMQLQRYNDIIHGKGNLGGQDTTTRTMPGQNSFLGGLGAITSILPMFGM